MTGISGSIGVYYQNARVRFLCPLPLPLASLWCIVLDADSDDSALLASWALTALSTAWRRTFSGILSTPFSPWILSIAIDLSSSRGIRPVRSRLCACVFGSAPN